MNYVFRLSQALETSDLRSSMPWVYALSPKLQRNKEDLSASQPFFFSILKEFLLHFV